MTVENQVPYQSFTANGSQTNFALGFYVDDKDHFEVKKNDQAVSKSDYSYNSSSNTIFFNSPPDQGDVIEVQRSTAADRATTYATYNNSFRPEVLNKDIDRIWLKIQELGVADALLKIYTDRLHAEQKGYIDNQDQAIRQIVADLKNYVNQQDNSLLSSISNLKTYVDNQDNQRNNYFSDLIYKQGISLKQLNSYYDNLMQRIAAIAVDKGWEASLVVDSTIGKTQAEINAKQAIKNKEYRINVLDYGVILNDKTVDNTAAIHRAFTENPQHRRFYFPKGECYANIVIPRTYIQLEGDGLQVSKIIAFDPSKSAINLNKRLYQSLKDLTVATPYNATASVINARDSRYINIDDVEIIQLPDTAGAYSYSVSGLDMRKDTGTWTGYNYFNNCKFNYCAYGIDIDTSLASVCYFNNCTISSNGYFGAKLIGVGCGGMNNCDIAGNGKLGEILGEFDETKYGGVYVKGSNFTIEKCWHEYNHNKYSMIGATNDIYIHPDSINVTEISPRYLRTKVGSYTTTQSQGQQERNYFTDVPADGGMGLAHYQSLISNGRFKHETQGWLGINIGQAIIENETIDLPKGFESGLKVNSKTNGVVGLYQKLFETGNSDLTIKDISRYEGKTISATFWVKNLSTYSDLRAGFETNEVGGTVYFTTGSYISATPPGEWAKVVITYTIKGTEPRIFFGFRTIGSAIVTGFNMQFGPRVSDSEPKIITEDGGSILGDLKINGTNVAKITDITDNIQVRSASDSALKSAINSININKRHPSFAFNTTTGKMYYSSGSTATSAWRSTDNTGDIVPV